MAPDSAATAGNDAGDLSLAPFVDANATEKHRIGRFNLGIIGATGVGKSSLVNAVFGRDLARVGKGLPVTEGVHYYHDDALGIWDFEGFEIGSRRTPGEALREHLRLISQRPADEQISVVWYCVAATADRLTQPDIEMIRELHQSGLPVMLVLTKVDWQKNPLTGKYSPLSGVGEFRDWLEHPVDHAGMPIDIPIQRVMLTSTIGKNGKGTGHGLGDLVTETLALAPANTRDAFQVAQRLNLPWKRNMARKAVTGAAGLAAASAAVPIPVADAMALAPIQLAMMGRISAIYELDLKAMIAVSTLAQFSAEVAGRALARSFLKLIPGVGSVVNATVAAALTAATGESWIRLCERIHTGKLDLAQVSDVWGEAAPTMIDTARELVKQRFTK